MILPLIITLLEVGIEKWLGLLLPAAWKCLCTSACLGRKEALVPALWGGSRWKSALTINLYMGWGILSGGRPGRNSASRLPSSGS